MDDSKVLREHNRDSRSHLRTLPEPVPKITDFGLAKKLDEAAGPTQSGAIMGTPSYMAPEQAAGKTQEIRAAADVYALGAILYEILTGRPPFQGRNAAGHRSNRCCTSSRCRPTQLQPKLPRDLETICLKCLRKEPAQRAIVVPKTWPTTCAASVPTSRSTPAPHRPGSRPGSGRNAGRRWRP